MGIQDRDYYWEDRDLAGQSRPQAKYFPPNCHWSIRVVLVAIALAGIACCVDAWRGRQIPIATPIAGGLMPCQSNTAYGQECVDLNGGVVKRIQMPPSSRPPQPAPVVNINGVGRPSNYIEWSGRPDTRRTVDQ